MTIDFYYMPESPPCRAVEMVANMIGVELNKHHLNLAKKEHLSEDYIRLNPLHKVPFIVDGDLKIGESRAIMAYLVNKYKPDNEHLYPRDPNARARIDELLHYEIGTLYPATSRLLRPKIWGNAKELNKDDEKVFREALQYYEKRLGENGARRFMLGNNLTIADISLAAGFTLILACSYDLNEFKNIVAYIERMKAAIPNYSEINDKPCQNMKNFIENKQPPE